MAETLLWSDDFAYANDAALEAAYPYEFDSGVTSVSSGVNVVTPGPTGYATGIDCGDVNLDYGPAFDVAQWIIHPTTRCFHFRGVWQIDTVDGTNPSQSLVNMRAMSADGADYYGQYWQLSARLSDLTELLLTVNGGNGTIADYPNPAYSTGYVPGILTPNAANQIDVVGYTSSLSETSPGVFAPNTDGTVSVSVNGVQVFSWSGIVWNYTNTLAAMQWNLFEIHPSGTFSGLRIWQCGDADVVDNSDACGCTPLDADTAAAGGGTGAGASANQYPSIGAQIVCVGGGLVPTQSDLVFSEVWWSN